MTALTNDGARQKSARDVSGTTGTYEEDMLALCVSQGIVVGTYNERMIGFVNGQLSSSYTNVNDALNAFAVSQGAANWSSLGAFTVGGIVLSTKADSTTVKVDSTLYTADRTL